MASSSFTNLNVYPILLSMQLLKICTKHRKGYAHPVTARNSPLPQLILASCTQSCLKNPPFVLFILGFCGFLRFSEMANIRRSDIIFCDSYIKIFIAHSKTDDVYRDGKWIYISRSAIKYCPVKNLEHYLQFGSILETSTEYIFRGIQKYPKQNREA